MSDGNTVAPGAAKLRERLEEDPPTSIILKDGDVFVGTFNHIERGESAYGPCLVAVFTDPDVSAMLEPPEIPEGGRASLWLLHNALLKRMKRLRPAKGDWLGVKRLGKATSGNSRDFINYSVASENEQAGEVTWDQIDPLAAERTGQFDDEFPY
jgi:hypothetical protein